MMMELIQSPIPREKFQQWMDTGTTPLLIQENHSYHTVLMLPKTEQIHYLFHETGYCAPGIHRDDRFTFCGIYFRQDCSLHLLDHDFGRLVEGLTPAECMDNKALQDAFCEQVNRRVEEIIANDRKNLTITELSSDRKRELDYYQKYSAISEASHLFPSGEMPDIRFHSHYQLLYWKEDDLLAYIQDPEAVIQSEAEQYIESHQEVFLLAFLRNDALLSAYQKLEQDAGNPIHRMRAITAAIRDCGAKSVTVTIQKDGKELSFKANASSLTGYKDYYSNFYIPAQDRRKFQKLFGRQDYCPEDITKITYGRNTIYEAQPVQTEDMAGPEMGGMNFG